MSPTPGILYVTMQPKDTLPAAKFHDWYNNEHGPGRLRLPFCLNGFRYRATDLESQSGSQGKPEWMAIYDIDDMDWLTKDVYTSLRQSPKQSQRERDTMKQIHVDRRFYDLISESKGKEFQKLEDVGEEGTGNRMVVEYTSSEPSKEALERIENTSGWRRTRVFVTSYLDIKDGRSKEYLTIHEFAPGKEAGAQSKEAKRRTYDLYYTFGPASRDLSSLSSTDTAAAESTDGLTKSFPAHIFSTPKTTAKSYPIITSYITTPDGVILPYRLSGSGDPAAPMLVLINSILTTHEIWSTFTAVFLTLLPQYRVLAYNTRGRSSLPEGSTSPITVDTLSKDVITILDALRVKKASVVGVSLGGATALNTALSYPDRITAFVSCDTNSVAPPGNPKAWGERIVMCEKEGAKATSGEPIVGEDLAEVTTRRWFVKESYEDPVLVEMINEVKEMVAANSLEGFKKSVNALYEYDFRPKMMEYRGKGAFLVGAGDGVLPKTMKEMAAGLGDGEGVHLEVVDGAGHLPMVEKPLEVAQFIAQFLE